MVQADEQPRPQVPSHFVGAPTARLLIASATALVLELACIRWAGSHIIYLAYVSNLLLITAFLGLGLGIWLSTSLSDAARTRWLRFGPVTLLALVSCVAFSNVAVHISGSQVVYFGNAVLHHLLPAWIVLPALGFLAATCFASLGTSIGHELSVLCARDASYAGSLRAYSVDIIGSLAGIVVFSVASFFEAPAYVWFAAVVLGFLVLSPARMASVATTALAGLLTLAVVQWSDFGSEWSPYQRVEIAAREPASARAPGDPAAGTPGYRLSVNNIVHQFISDVRQREPFYEVPYRAAGASLPGGPQIRLTAVPPEADWSSDPFAPRPYAWGGRVAIIGAGNGTDVAVALAYGAGHVDAVELDPTIARIGAQLQPNRPFSDARVQVHIMDGRTFLERRGQRYDLIVFGLPDSLTLASPYASVRLESFLFTEEAFASALRRLDPEHGLLVAYNYFRKPWLLDRIAGTLAHAAGQEPLVFRGPDRLLSAVFLAGPGLSRVSVGRALPPGYSTVTVRNDVGTAVDDWPFLYLRNHAIPPQIGLALTILICFAGGAFAITRRFSLRTQNARGARAPSALALAPFFFMGVAFLLLETSGLVRMALLFGSTWFVNALVFGAVLLMVLVANAIAARFPLRNPSFVFVLLLLALVIAFVVKPSALSSWPALPKFIVATCALFLPILLANLAFSRAFRDFQWPASAFGANLIGAVVGGALENVALIAGYSALLLVAAGLYSAAWYGISLGRQREVFATTRTSTVPESSVSLEP